LEFKLEKTGVFCCHICWRGKK